MFSSLPTSMFHWITHKNHIDFVLAYIREENIEHPYIYVRFIIDIRKIRRLYSQFTPIHETVLGNLVLTYKNHIGFVIENTYVQTIVDLSHIGNIIENNGSFVLICIRNDNSVLICIRFYQILCHAVIACHDIY